LLAFRMWISTNLPSSMLPSYVHFGTFSPHRCYASTEQNHNQPATNLNWAKLDTFQACEICLFFAVVVRLECSTQNMRKIPRGNSFSQFLFLQKSKGKRTPSHPNGLSCAHAQGTTWHIRAGEEQRVWQSRQISHPAVESDDIPADHFYYQKMLSIFVFLHISTINLCDLRKPIL
jgi:hypothetical protein